MCKLAHAVMSEPALKKICSTSEYSCEPVFNARAAKLEEQQQNDNKEVNGEKEEKICSPRKVITLQKPTYNWENTNKLLGVPGFVGCKTGITPAAGPCLAAAYER